MRRLLWGAFSLILILLLIPAFAVNANAANSDRYTFEVSGGEATITGVDTSISGNITIPSTLGGYPVTAIGDGAFTWCSDLTSITIPNSVTSIGNDTFYRCDNLTRVSIGNGVTTIGVLAFSDCYSLTNITIPSSVASIGDYAFSGCRSLTGIWVDRNNKSYSNDEKGVLFNYDKTVLITVPGGFIGSYFVPDSVNNIVDGAFSCCTKLTNVSLPDNLTTIGNDLFYDCSGLTSITIPDSVTTIGYSAFIYCSSLTSITIPSSVISIGENAFCCAGLTSITIPDRVNTIGDAAFSRCYDLTNVSIGNSVISIGDAAFSGCTSLTNIQFNSTAMGDLDFENYVFANAGQSTNGISVTIGANVTKIPAYLFQPGNFDEFCPPKIVSVYFEQGSICNTIGASAFCCCNHLTSITMPNSITIIGELAFHNCYGLTDVIIPNSVTTIGDSAFSGCENLTSVTIPNSVTTIGGSAFHWCTGLTSIMIPESVTSIGPSAFSFCTGLTNIEFNATKMDDLSIYNDVFYYAGQNDSGIAVTIGANVTKIPAYLFFPYNNETSNAPKIVSVIFEEGSKCKNIGNYSFYKCYSLTSATIGDSVATIGEGAFYDCYMLTSIIIPDSVNIIGVGAFCYCTGLNSITIGKNVTSIGTAAFYDCCSLTSINIPDSVTTIGEGAFCNCTGLKTAIYCGTATQWNNIEIGDYNTSLTEADRKYHNWASATCTAPKFCTICDETEGNALGHSYSFEVTQTPTISAEGNLTGICAKCSDTITVTLPKLDNSNYSCKEITSSTCIKTGTDRYSWRITTYGSYYFDVIVPATGHTYGYDDICITCGRIKSIGDLNEDGKIDNKDVEYLLWYTLFPKDYPVVGDVDFDGNGKIDNKDVEYILWHTLFPEDYPL